jgi:archaemetzincin
MNFTPPGSEEQLAAIGPTVGLPESLRRALDPKDDFAPVPVPGPNDWLSNHLEEGQSFEAFLRSRSHQPDAQRSKLYFQPLGEFLGESPSLALLQQFASAFFALEVKVLPALDLMRSNITARQNPFTHQLQLLTSDILRLLRKHLPDDAYALLGMTMEDLYPQPSWNFVFGQASLRERGGVYSFARYHPRFYGEEAKDIEKLMLQRSCKVLAHETGPMFGIRHCIYFH